MALKDLSTDPSPREGRVARPAWAADQRVVLVGVVLLMSCVVIAILGMWGVTAIQEDHTDLASRDAPALALLLQLDRDLYQAELGAERAATAKSVNDRDAGAAMFATNVTEAETRYGQFRSLAARAQPSERAAKALAAFESGRTAWVESTQQVIALASDGEGALDDAAIVQTARRAREHFEQAREQVNTVIDEVYEPAIEAAEVSSARNASSTRWKILAGMSVAVCAGIVLTHNAARTLRLQQRLAAESDARQHRLSKRQHFEARFARGLDMIHDEPGTLKLAEEVMRITVPEVSAEIRLADSSRAHLHQAASTATDGRGRICDVAKPSDCPAVRRGHRLTFDSSRSIDACPHLRGRPTGNCSAVCIPLSIMGQTVGVLHAVAADNNLPGEEQVASLEHVASKSGERIGLLRAFRRTEAQASRDPLTGLMNRRSFEEKVNELARENIPYAVAYGDLDHFKNLNDTHGHETGDRALRKFAQVLQSAVRPSDLSARWGGEEFVLVLPRASAKDAEMTLSRVREALAAALRGASTPAFTVSFGVAEAFEGSAFSEVLAHADEALLRAKREGRDRTVISASVAPPTTDASSAIEAVVDSIPPVAA